MCTWEINYKQDGSSAVKATNLFERRETTLRLVKTSQRRMGKISDQRERNESGEREERKVIQVAGMATVGRSGDEI